MRRTRSRPADSTMLDASSGCLKRMGRPALHHDHAGVGRGIQGCESVDLQGEPHTVDGRLREERPWPAAPARSSWKAGHALPNETVQL